MGIESNPSKPIDTEEYSVSSIFDKLRQDIIQLLSKDTDSDYTIITLYQRVKNTIEWNDYFYLLIQLINAKKIHIEDDGYISWLWNPNLITKIQSENLLLEWGLAIIQIGFINEKVKIKYFKLKEGDDSEREIAKLIDLKIIELKKTPFLGTYIKKTFWPKEYKKYSLSNLRKINLNNNIRLIYTVITSSSDDVVVLIEWFDHKEYERRFGYN